MPAPPPLSPEQRDHGLALAAEAKRQRARLKDELRAGRVSIAELLARSGEHVVGTLKVFDVLQTLRGVGKVRASRIMDRLGIAQSRRLQGLGAKQMESLLKEFTQP